MRRVELTALIPDHTPQQVLPEIIRFDRYPQLAPHVRSAVVHRSLPEPTGRSDWELHFRSGLLRWTEEEVFEPARGRITFAQTTGDFDELTGEWTLVAAGPDTELTFRADFDFGIPSLAGILDPIAERVIRETIAFVVTGIYDRAVLRTPMELPTTAPATA
ncbi:Ribosome association toxin PasT (RatA) of the RatAB toxin-antitoxin module [Micromonospora matsumotoense]|uniref:Ribosome association toxin PasT (RatA) of the RatAB toxin-antitoxin module n=1 Tax=Micromonospora matsumotoense TaxID=121616 RepID=A0A1C5AWW8_9ACTN|nr:SRPBCC family protein [Micromonospora matsumotoense]SCF49719.1 Ribosome association toxin PasT (RatA) of the RatAB toxin-antitoxin module [Micromonospora matsumotoense]